MSDSVVIRLRPHHGLCLGFFEGYSCSDDFSANMARVLRSLKKENAIKLAEVCGDCEWTEICQNKAYH